MSRAHDLAWCAGFFDGEGFIIIQKRKLKRGEKIYTGHYLRIGINHVRPEPLEEIKRVLGGTLRFDSNSVLHCKDGYIRKPRYSWTASTQEAGQALLEMMPYFKNKNKEAALALDFLKTIQTHKQTVPDEVTFLREQFHQAIKNLNANG